ncbi:MAG: efflux RND transporter permease subunit [Mariniphaga sp.]|nr:efflux RND transporter permease subunit [Mariniphaga sp.]
MKKLVELFVRFPFYANLVIVFLLIVGGLSMVTMKKSFFPERPSRMLFVSVMYPGASPIEMEEGVTSRIEEAVRAIPGIYEITSTSSENSSRITIEIIPGYDIDEALIEIKNAVDGISSFPTAAERPIVSKSRTTSPAMNLLITGDVDLLTLKGYAQQIEEEFLASGFISQVSISGYPALEISVEANEENLLRYGITFNELQNAISQNNRDISGGQIRSMEEEILIRLRSRSSDPNKIGDIILRANPDGSLIRIRDIALVKKKFSDTPNKAIENGKPVINIMVMKLITEDLSKIDKYIREYVDNFNVKNPNINLIISRSYLEVLGSRLELLYRNGGQGLILVVLALGLMLSTRLSLWVAWGIPASFLAMFIVANLMGITINIMSLFGMILVIGILVDDGIVIGENIFQHFEGGKSPMRAAVDGTVEVIPAVLTSVTTTMIAFTPLIFITGRMEMMFEMAVIVILSLFFSLFEAFFVLPAHLGNKRVLNRKILKAKNKGIRKYTERFFTWLRDYAYDRVLKLIIEWRYIVIAVPVAMMLITAGLIGGQFIKTTFFPRMEFDEFDINIAFTPGSGEKQTMAYLERFDSIVWVVNEELKKEYNDSVDIIENSILQLGTAFGGNERGAHTGSVGVSPRNTEESGVSAFDIIQKIRQKAGTIPEAEKFTIGASRMRFGKPVSIGLLSRNIEQLERSRDFLYSKLKEMPQLKDVVNTNALGKQEILLKLKSKAYMLGFTESSIANQVRQGFYGGQAQRLQEGRDELRIWVRYPAEGRERLGQMEQMKIKTPNGVYPLTELVDYEMKRGPVNIQRFNSKREMRIDADLVDPDASVTDILEQIKTEIIPELEMTYPGIFVEFQGQQKESERNMADLMILFPLAFLAIIFILMINFKSFEQPLLILIMIPIAILGSIWGHGIHGKPLSILSFFGIVALTGVIINDAVVFLAKYNLLIEQGKKTKDAIITAGKSRLRPIILTTLTTSFGLFPLILEKSLQAQFLIPMAISLVYGVAFGTMFILLFFPALILVLNDFRKGIRQLWHGRKFKREEVEIAWIHAQRKFDDKENNDKKEKE